MRLRAKIRVYNDHILQARKDKGWTVRQLVEESGVRDQFIYALQRMDYTYQPLGLARAAHKIAKALGINVDLVLPPELMGEKLMMIEDAVIEVPAARMLAVATQKRLTVESPLDILTESDVPVDIETMRKAMEHLDERQMAIITLRYGLDGRGEHTLKEAGRAVGVTRERVRQIENEALRGLYYRTMKDQELRRGRAKGNRYEHSLTPRPPPPPPPQTKAPPLP